MNLIKLSMAVAISAALAACGGGGGGGSSGGNTGGTGGTVVTPTAAIKITPMKGKFSVGTTVRVKRSKDGVQVGTCTVDATGSCSASIAKSETGPFLIEAGIAGDTYFDESTGASATVPAGQPALRALIPDATTSTNVGVTALTEFAVGQVEVGSGVASVTSIGVVAANATIGSQFGVTDLLVPPTVVASGTKVNGGNAADDYALKLAGIAKMAGTGISPVQALHDLRDDIKDGKFDGLVGTTPLTSLVFTVPTGGMTSAQLSTQIATQVQAATTTYGVTGATAPTVTLTVQDLAALLAAAMQVGAEAQRASAGSQLTTAQLNTQIASTVNTQVGNISTAVAGGTTIAAATTTAVANTTAAATALASTGGTNQADFMAGLASGWYWMNQNVGTTAPNGGQITTQPVVDKSISNTAGSTMTIANSTLVWNFATGALQPAGSGVAAAGGGWVLTATSGGWVSQNATANMTITSNADGTISWSNSTDGTSGHFLPSVQVLDGKPLQECVSATNPTGANCAAGDVYPVGSKYFDFIGQVNNVDQYNLWSGGGMGPITDTAGITLTALPAVGTSFCANQHFFRAISGAAVGADNYDVIYSGVWNGTTSSIPGCTAANWALANAITSVANNRTVSIVGKTIGTTPVLKVQRVSQTTDIWLLNMIYGAVAGTVYEGNFQPAGPIPTQNQGGGNYNKTAIDADLAFIVSRTPVMRYIADLTSAQGVTEFFPSGLPQAPNNVTWVAVNRKWVAGATAGTYTQSMTSNELTFPAVMAQPSWVAKTFLTEKFPTYYMSAATTTWTVFDGVQTWTLNPDGTLTTVSPRAGTLTMNIVRKNLNGTPIFDPVNGGVIGTYPTSGANAYSQVGATSTTANYRIYVDPFDLVTDLTGAAATVVPTAGASFCTQATVFRPFAFATGENYEALSTTDCSGAAIAITAAAAAGTGSPVTLAQMPVLNGAAPVVMGITTGIAKNGIIASVPNGVYSGQYQPAGKALGYIFDMSWTAANATATAMGAPTLP